MCSSDLTMFAAVAGLLALWLWRGLALCWPRLALRIAANGNAVPEPDQALTRFEQIQYGALTFVDKTRTELQRYATGYAGSKLGYARKLLLNLFTLTDNLTGRAREQLNRARMREFMGLAGRTKS